MKPIRHSGFTLIELSIVLVIIGLIVGGILTGRDMIKAAANMRIVSQITEYKSSIAVFRSKYNCLPGDCQNATGFFGSTANGNDDGIVNTKTSGNYGSWGITNLSISGSDSGIQEEVFLANEHLSKAGLVALAPFNARTDPFPGTLVNTWAINLGSAGSNLIIASDASRRNLIRLSVTWTPGQDVVFRPTFISVPSFGTVTAFYLDSKIDDGLPRTGLLMNEDFIGAYAGGDSWGCTTTMWSNIYDTGNTVAGARDGPCELSLYDAY